MGVGGCLAQSRASSRPLGKNGSVRSSSSAVLAGRHCCACGHSMCGSICVPGCQRQSTTAGGLRGCSAAAGDALGGTGTRCSPDSAQHLQSTIILLRTEAAAYAGCNACCTTTAATAATAELQTDRHTDRNNRQTEEASLPASDLLSHVARRYCFHIASTRPCWPGEKARMQESSL